MSTIVGLDPGPERSATVRLVDSMPSEATFWRNEDLLLYLRGGAGRPDEGLPVLALEMIEGFGMPVGKEVLETVRWIGRFGEAHERMGGTVRLVTRKSVKLYLCETTRANDTAIRSVLIDRYGGGLRAIGTKGAPGPLHGLKRDQWSALAVAIVAEAQIRPETRPA